MKTISGPLITVGKTCESGETDGHSDCGGGSGAAVAAVPPLMVTPTPKTTVGDLALYDGRSSRGDSKYSASEGDGGTSRVACDSGTAIVVDCGGLICCDGERPREHAPPSPHVPFLAPAKATFFVRAPRPREDALPCYFPRAATSRR